MAADVEQHQQSEMEAIAEHLRIIADLMDSGRISLDYLRIEGLHEGERFTIEG